jgi:hypothetical protein
MNSETVPKAATLLNDCFDQIAQVFALPAQLWKKCEPQTVLSDKTKKSEKGPDRLGFPYEPSVYRTIGMLLLEQHERWIPDTDICILNE